MGDPVSAMVLGVSFCFVIRALPFGPACCDGRLLKKSVFAWACISPGRNSLLPASPQRLLLFCTDWLVVCYFFLTCCPVLSILADPRFALRCPRWCGLQLRCWYGISRPPSAVFFPSPEVQAAFFSFLYCLGAGITSQRAGRWNRARVVLARSDFFFPAVLVRRGGEATSSCAFLTVFCWWIALQTCITFHFSIGSATFPLHCFSTYSFFLSRTSFSVFYWASLFF